MLRFHYNRLPERSTHERERRLPSNRIQQRRQTRRTISQTNKSPPHSDYLTSASISTPLESLSKSITDSTTPGRYLPDHHRNQRRHLPARLQPNFTIADANMPGHSSRIPESSLSDTWILPDTMDVGTISMAIDNSTTPMGSIHMEPSKHSTSTPTPKCTTSHSGTLQPSSKQHARGKPSNTRELDDSAHTGQVIATSDQPRDTSSDGKRHEHQPSHTDSIRDNDEYQFNTRGARTTTTARHSSRGSLHRSSDRIRTIHNLPSNKKKLLGDSILTRTIKDVHLLLSPKCLQNVICIAKSNSTNRASGEESGYSDHPEGSSNIRDGEQQQYDGQLAVNNLMGSIPEHQLSDSPPPMIFIL